MNNNTPIIDPMIFYWAELLDASKFVCALIFVISLFFTFYFIIDSQLDLKTLFGDEPHKKRYFILSLISTVVFLILTIIIPSKETYLTMVLSKYVTESNIINSKNFILDFLSALHERTK